LIKRLREKEQKRSTLILIGKSEENKKYLKDKHTHNLEKRAIISKNYF